MVSIHQVGGYGHEMGPIRDTWWCGKMKLSLLMKPRKSHDTSLNPREWRWDSVTCSDWYYHMCTIPIDTSLHCSHLQRYTEAPETGRDQFQPPMQAPCPIPGVPNQGTRAINCSSLVINYEYQVSKLIGLEMNTGMGFRVDNNSGLCKLSLKIQNKIIHDCHKIV